MSYAAREAHPDDLDTLVAFTLAEAQEAEGHKLDSETVQRGVMAGLTDPNLATYWVLEEDEGQIVGSVSVVKEWSNWHAGMYWWIQSIYIRPEKRGQRLIRHLLDAVTEAAQQQGALELRLYAHRDNTRALRAYQRQGFIATPYVVMSMSLDRALQHGGRIAV